MVGWRRLTLSLLLLKSSPESHIQLYYRKPAVVFLSSLPNRSQRPSPPTFLPPAHLISQSLTPTAIPWEHSSWAGQDPLLSSKGTPNPAPVSSPSLQQNTYTAFLPPLPKSPEDPTDLLFLSSLCPFVILPQAPAQSRHSLQTTDLFCLGSK